MKFLKKPISVILAALMLLSAFSVCAYAAETDKSKTGGMFKTIEFTAEKNIALLDWEGYHEGAIAGASYDESTNTLTLDNVDFAGKHGLELYFMGEDFTLEVHGACTLDPISVYDGCLTITGDGSLEVRKSDSYKNGVYFGAEAKKFYPSKLAIDKNVSVKFSGEKHAVFFQNSTTDKDSVFTVSGSAVEVNAEEEISEDVHETTNGLEVKECDAFLMKNEDEDEDALYAGIRTVDGENVSFEIHECRFDEASGTYRAVDPFSYSEMSEGSLEHFGYSFVTENDEKQTIKYVEEKYIYEATVYTGNDSKKYAVDYCDEVYEFSDDNKTEYEGKEEYLFTKASDVEVSNLTPVTSNVKYRNYSYEATEFTADKEEKVGSRPSVYLNGEDSQLLYIRKGAEFEQVNEVQGVSFDNSMQTLTLNNLNAPDKKLVIYNKVYKNLTLELKGENRLGQLAVYDGGLTVSGGGALTIESGEDCGFVFEQSGEAYYNSPIVIEDGTTFRVSGQNAAFCINNTSLSQEELGFDKLNKTSEQTLQVGEEVHGLYTYAWSDGMGFRYKIKNENEPDAVFCGQYTKTTHMNAYGKPADVVETWDMRRVRYDEEFGCYVITENLGVLDGIEFKNRGFEVEANGNYPIQITCYNVVDTAADVYRDSDGKKYAVISGDVYNYSENNKNSEGKLIFSYNSDVSADSLTRSTLDVSVCSYTYGEKTYAHEAAVIDPTVSEEPSTAAVTTEPKASEEVSSATNPEDTSPSTEPGDTSPSTEPGDTVPSTEPGDTVPSTEPGDTVPSTEPTDTVPSTQPEETTAPTQPDSTAPTTALVDAPTESTAPATSPTTPDGKTDISGWTVSGVSNMTYTGKLIKLNVIVSREDEYADVEVSYRNNLNAGTATAIITGTGDYTGTIVKTFKINKAKQSLSIKASKKKYKLKKLKKGVKVKALSIKNNKGKLSFKLKSVPKKLKKLLKINSKGVITVKKWKKAEKGTYKTKVKITSAATQNFAAASKTVTVRLTVK